MPRDAFSNYTLPAGNPVVTGTIIASSWANTTLNDIATALTQSLSTDGTTATVSLANKTLNGGTFSSNTFNSSTINAGNLAGITNVSGGRLQFPASQIASADVNTLDDYEEGTWTPALSFAVPGTSSFTYTVQAGSYQKVGKLVTVAFDIQISGGTLGTASGRYQINGLPFQIVSGGNTYNAMSTFGGFTLPASRVMMGIEASSGNNFLGINTSGSGVPAADAQVSNTTLTGGTTVLRGQISYFATN